MRKFFIFASITLLLIGIAIGVLTSINSEPYTVLKEKRHNRSLSDDRRHSPNNPIRIAVVWPYNEPLFWEGLELACDSINRHGIISDDPGVRGRKLKIVRYDESAAMKKDAVPRLLASTISRSIARHTDIVAVIGHCLSATAIPASIAYQASGVLFIATSSTNPSLTLHRFEYVFRTIPTDRDFSFFLASLAKECGKRQFGIVYSRDECGYYGRSFASFFRDQTYDLGGNIRFERSYNAKTSDFRPLASDIKEVNVDALLLADYLPRAGDFIRQLRRNSLPLNILAGDGIDSPDLLKYTMQDDSVYVATIFHEEFPSPRVADFCSRFYHRYRHLPDLQAAQAYEAVLLLAKAIELSGSSVPLELATTLKTCSRFEGLTGDYRFESNGDIIGKPILLQTIRGGRFHLVPPNICKGE